MHGRTRLALPAIILIIVILGYYTVMNMKRGEMPKRRVEILINPSKILGRFKDWRGVNCGPLSPRGWDKRLSLNLTERYLEIGVKVIRFHDFYPFDELDHIFPDPKADPSKPESYSFAELDKYMEAAFHVADAVIFRIGYDWNNPPKNKPHVSLGKLAEIVKHIVMHYMKGWSKGYNYKSILWEVWNEPDIEQFWNGTPEQYFELYEAVARAVKEVDPNAMVGGPTLAYKLDFLEQFLNYTRSREVPIDFVSWHVYATNPRHVIDRAFKVYSIMKRYGYGDLPSVLDEWNYWLEGEPWERFRGPMVAAFQASVLIYLQDAPVDLAALYRGDAWTWGGLFNSDGEPGKPFYTWLAYKQLLDTRRIETNVTGTGISVIAGLSSKGDILLLISNYDGSRAAYTVKAPGYRLLQVLSIDETHSLEPLDVCDDDTCIIEPYAVHLVTLAKT